VKAPSYAAFGADLTCRWIRDTGPSVRSSLQKRSFPSSPVRNVDIRKRMLSNVAERSCIRVIRPFLHLKKLADSETSCISPRTLLWCARSGRLSGVHDQVDYRAVPSCSKCRPVAHVGSNMLPTGILDRPRPTDAGWRRSGGWGSGLRDCAERRTAAIAWVVPHVNQKNCGWVSSGSGQVSLVTGALK
jgi:hypothetical protein